MRYPCQCRIIAAQVQVVLGLLILTAQCTLPTMAIRPLAPIKIAMRISTNTNSITNTKSNTNPLFSSSILTEVPTHLSILRGGASYDSDDEDSDFDSDFDDDEDLFGLDIDGFDIDDTDDFTEQSTLSRAWSAFTASPPLTKIYLSSCFAASALGYLQNKNDFPKYLLFDWKKTITKFQFWRPITAFLNFGPLSLGWLMTAHFVWTYMSTLERLNYATPYEFWYMIAFGGTSMVLGYTVLKIPPRFLGHNLSTFLVYVWSRYHEGLEVNMFEMFNTRAEMLPWFFLAQTFLLEGEFPILDLLGIVFGHVYHYLRGVGGIGRCPKVVRDWYENGDDDVVRAIRGEYKKISSDFVMQ